MRQLIGTAIILSAVCGFGSQEAQAQLFGGSRTIGAPLSQQQGAGGGLFGGQSQAPGAIPGATPAPGALQPSTMGPSPNSRYLRQNRGQNNFVGNDGNSNNPNGLNSRPAALDAIERRVPESLLNPPRTPTPRNRMYDPKLTVGFQYTPRLASEISENLRKQVSGLSQMDPSLQLTTSEDGRTVRLEGFVHSEREKELIEQLMLFEPGISAVQNDLRVLSAVPSSF